MLKKFISLFLVFILILVGLNCSVVFAETNQNYRVFSPSVGNIGDKYFIIGDVLYENNFDNETVGSLPEGWSYGHSKGTGVHKTSFGWALDSANNSSITAKVADFSNHGKTLHFQTNGVDAYMALPCINTVNYIYEATVVVNSNSGSLGLANNFYESTDKSSGAMFTVFYPNTTTASIYRYSNGGTKGEWNQTFNPKKGDELKLKIISFNGNNYIYYNDILVATNPWRTVKDGTYTKDAPGFYSCNGNFYITDVKVRSILTTDITLENMRVVINKDKTVSVENELSYDKKQQVFKNYFEGDYTYKSDSDFILGAVVYIGDSDVSASLTTDTKGALVRNFKNNNIYQNANEINIKHREKISSDNLQKTISVRPYALINGIYFYGNGKAYNVANLANSAYRSAENEEEKSKIQEVFNDFDEFTFSTDSKQITFTLFSDFHYNDGQYASSMSDFYSIIDRAKESNSSFILSSGDFCNDFIGSPELTNAFLDSKNSQGETLLAYNVYGNHELESKGTMEYVTPLLTNDKNVVWGDGTRGNKPENTNIAYYYFEQNGFRFVCLDNNYSYNPNHKNGVEVGWEHNLPNSYGSPLATDNAKRNFDEGSNAVANTKTGSLAPTQMQWLENVLLDAADKDIPCVIVGHAGYSGLGFGGGAADAEQVRAIYKKANTANPGTVLVSINGHIHTDNQGWNDNVFYIDVNTVRNCYWASTSEHHYTNEHTFKFEEYDDKGNLISITDKPLSSLSMGKNTWFSKDPLSCVVTINESGMVIMDGTESEWFYGIAPSNADADKGEHCTISSGVFWDCDKYGHIEEKTIDDEYYHTECLASECNFVSAQFKNAVLIAGDCNNDGEVNTVDLTELKLFLAGVTSDTIGNTADLNGDDEINTVDLTELKLMLAGIT